MLLEVDAHSYKLQEGPCKYTDPILVEMKQISDSDDYFTIDDEVAKGNKKFHPHTLQTSRG